jgi:hypothetical protein
MPDESEQIVQPDAQIPQQVHTLNQNYYQVGFWAFLNGLSNGGFTFLLNLLTTTNGWMGMVILYLLYCLLVGRKFIQFAP